MIEEWKSVGGAEGAYEVSSLGAVRSLDRMVSTFSKTRTPMKRLQRGRVLRTWFDCNGYAVVYICGDGRREAINVHRIVAFAFCATRTGCNDVNHINGDKACNAATNLEWMTRKENVAHAIDIGLVSRRMRILSKSIETGEQVEYESTAAAALALGNKNKGGNISSAANGKLKQAYGFLWSYV
ncbi:MAG TPA: NUMOD4 domain-containing protein [Telluria sp.]|jgi:hypothetical protein